MRSSGRIEVRIGFVYEAAFDLPSARRATPDFALHTLSPIPHRKVRPSARDGQDGVAKRTLSAIDAGGPTPTDHAFHNGRT